MQLSTRPLRAIRSFLSLAIAATVLLTLLGPPAQATAGDSAAAAADWIAAELDKPEPSFDAFGKASARNDVIYALASTGGHEGAVRSAVADLRTGAADYIGPKGTANAGALGKVLLSVLIVNEDPTTFIAGRNLETELRASMGADGMFAVDVYSHSLAMIALGATAQGVPAKAAVALASRQCEDGDFTFMGTCPSASADVDTTALAVQALLAANLVDEAKAGAEFLAEIQNVDGSFPNPYGDPNANSAGVAGLALRAAGQAAAADLARVFVETLQTADGGIRFVAADTVANGYATLQGILAFDGPPLHNLEVNPYGDVSWVHPFSVEIDWLGDEGITRGCNPPDNDRFCPDDTVTRGQMAAFLVRALDLEDPGTAEFGDDDGSIFETDIARLATAGITRGCNPPDNDRFCPDDAVTRGQMAAFLHRALDATTTSGESADFVDDDESIYQADIAWLSGTGITRGCNPPDNDRFCPDDAVTRGQMAAFLYRALKG